MDIPTKAKINLKEGTIELEGSENFVTKYLEDLQKALLAAKEFSSSQATTLTAAVPTTKKMANKRDKKVHKSVKLKDQKVTPEDFDINASDGKPSLKAFIESKAPKEVVAHRIAVIGYYITKIKGIEVFTEGNIEFAYIALDLNKRPVYLHQAFIDAKNKNHFLIEVDGAENGWNLSRIGEIFVEEKLPSQVSGQ